LPGANLGDFDADPSAHFARQRMTASWDKIRSLRLSEILDRGNQYFCRRAERLTGYQFNLSDRDFLNRFAVSSSGQLLDYFRSKSSATHFYPCFAELGVIECVLVEELSNNLISEADAICIGNIPLLGMPTFHFNGTTPDWHYEPISDKRSPRIHWSKLEETNPEQTGDKKIIWELNRHQYFLTLGQAYLITCDEKYAQTFVDHVDNWIEHNSPKIGVNWLSSLELAFRSISWIWAYHFFKHSPAFTSDLFLRMLRFLYLNGRHIETYLSTYFSPNTHLTGEALGLYFLGSFMPELKEAQRWKEKGYEILVDALDFQVRPDGTYCEQSTHYLRYTIDFYCNLLILRRREGFDDESKIEHKLNKLFDFLLHITMPNGENPNFGDDDGGRLYFLDDRPVTDFRPALALGSVLLKRGDLKSAAEEPTPELLWLTGPDGLGVFNELPPTEPSENIKAFPDGGFFTARSNWSDSADYIAIDCGLHGFLNGGHAHADALSFVLAFDGRPVFIDSGTYNYTSEAVERNRFRSTVAHNCLTVNRESSSLPDGPFSWKSTADARLLEWCEVGEGVRFRGSHDGYERNGVKYEREISFGFNGQMKICEYIESSTENTYQVNFILSPGLAADILNDLAQVRIRDASGSEIAHLETSVSGQTTGRAGWSIEEWFVSPVYGARIKSGRLVFTAKAPANLLITTHIGKKSQ
jgi:hypothetical protein